MDVSLTQPKNLTTKKTTIGRWIHENNHIRLCLPPRSLAAAQCAFFQRSLLLFDPTSHCLRSYSLTSLSDSVPIQRNPSSLSAATATVNNPFLAHFSLFNVMSTNAIMPGLEACSAEFSPNKCLQGQKITVSCRTATEEAALTKTLTELGATVRSCSFYNILSTQDHAAAAAASDSASVFDQKGEISQNFLNCIKRGLDWGAGGGPNLIIDDEGIVLPFICACVGAEKNYAQKGGLPESSDFEVATQLFPSIIGKENFLSFIREGLEADPKRYHNLREGLLGVSVGTVNDWMQPMLKEDFRSLSFPVFDISDFVTQSKYCEMEGSRCSIGIKRGTNMTISGKTALVCGYNDDASKGCAMALKQGGAKVVVAEADPGLATQACLGGFLDTNKAPDDVVSEADILVVKFNMDNIDGFSNFKNMKNNAVIYNIDSSSDVALFEPYFPDMKQIILDSHTEKWVSSDSNKCVFTVSNPGYPNLMSSWSATSHVVAMLEFVSLKETGKYLGKVYAFPKRLEMKVSDLHLGKKAAGPFITKIADAMKIGSLVSCS